MGHSPMGTGADGANDTLSGTFILHPAALSGTGPDRGSRDKRSGVPGNASRLFEVKSLMALLHSLSARPCPFSRLRDKRLGCAVEITLERQIRGAAVHSPDSIDKWAPVLEGSSRLPPRGIRARLRSVLWVIARGVLVLAMCLLAIPYRDMISDFVGAHFPWPEGRWLISASIFAENFIIEALVCLPLVLPMALVFSRGAVLAAMAVSLPVVLRAVSEMPHHRNGIYGSIIVGFVALCHFLFLAGGTAIARANVKERGRDAVAAP